MADGRAVCGRGRREKMRGGIERVVKGKSVSARSGEGVRAARQPGRRPSEAPSSFQVPAGFFISNFSSKKRD
jgi:hypothetical protein